MAFTWILGKRYEPVEDPSEGEEVGSLREMVPNEKATINVAEMRLSIEDGLLMVYGPCGDPVPLLYLKEALVKQPSAKIRLPNGFAVNHKRLVDVIEAQQKGPLAATPTDRWIKAMLGADGSFEPTSANLLESEDAGIKAILPGKLTLDMPGDRTLTLRDIHPGDGCPENPVRLVLDNQAISIEALLDRASKDDATKGRGHPMIARRGEEVALLLAETIEARLEPAPIIWEGEAKVDFALGDGRDVSVADLLAMLEDASALKDRPLEGEPARTYPLCSVQEEPFDLQGATIILVSGMPDQWSLTEGLQSEHGDWMLDPSALEMASVEIRGAIPEAITLEIKVISLVGRQGSLKKQTREVVMPPREDDRLTEPAVSSNDDDRRNSPLHLGFDEAEICLAVSADALLLRGIPEGASLSAGKYDHSVQGWILMPDQLQGLVVHDLEQNGQPIDIELKAIHLDPKGQPRTDVIRKKTISLAA